MAERLPGRLAAALLVAAALVAPTAASQLDGAEPIQPSVPEPITFAEAIRRATERNPSVGQAAQAILRAQALLEQAKSVFRPTLYGSAGTTMLDAARGFNGSVTQPRVQSAFSVTLSYPILAASRWAGKNQAGDQLTIARVSAEETRRQVALAAAESYLAVITAQRLREIAVRNRDTARALADYAAARLEAGKGSRLNHVRATQQLASTEGELAVAELAVRESQEALGVVLFAEGPVDAQGDPETKAASPASDDEAWLAERPDVRLLTAQLNAAERAVRDSWTSWVPGASASFTPQYVTPPGVFEPAKTWRAQFQLEVPIYDGTLAAAKRARVAERETARSRLEALKTQARAELRLARHAVARSEQVVAASRLAEEGASEALRISEIAYKAGATSNIEVIQAQQTARTAELIAALAEDRLRQAGLDLLVALGQFPQ